VFGSETGVRDQRDRPVEVDDERDVTGAG